LRTWWTCLHRWALRAPLPRFYVFQMCLLAQPQGLPH